VISSVGAPRMGTLAPTTIRVGDIDSRASIVGGKHRAETGGEGFRIAGLGGVGTDEPAVTARELDRARPEPLRDCEPAAPRDRVT